MVTINDEDTMDSWQRLQCACRKRLRGATRLAGLLLIGFALASCTDLVGVTDRDLDIIWPRDGARLYDEETLRARLRGYDVDDYEIFWYVDDSRERRMWNERYGRPPYKAFTVDTWFWDWRGRGPYTVGFVAVDRRGREVARRSVRVYVE
jgi:hypothetical protein